MTAERTSFQELLDDLREAPPVGSWVLIRAVWVSEDPEGWSPDVGRPQPGHFETRAQAEQSARNRKEAYYVAQVVSVPQGWTTSEPFWLG